MALLSLGVEKLGTSQAAQNIHIPSEMANLALSYVCPKVMKRGASTNSPRWIPPPHTHTCNQDGKINADTIVSQNLCLSSAAEVTWTEASVFLGTSVVVSRGITDQQERVSTCKRSRIAMGQDC